MPFWRGLLVSSLPTFDERRANSSSGPPITFWPSWVIVGNVPEDLLTGNTGRQPGDLRFFNADFATLNPHVAVTVALTPSIIPADKQETASCRQPET